MVNLRKCHLGLNEAQYIGYRIGQGLLKPQEKKTEAVKGYPQPANKPFLGLARYYHRFVPNFSSLESPLSDPTRKGHPDQVQWFEEAEQAFQAMKHVLISSPVLQNTDFDMSFTMHINASETTLGTVLSQTFWGP